MFVRRLTTSLKEQHWMTIVIELVIVIIGVFIGNQVSNWNETRVEKAQTDRLLEQLRPELGNQIDFIETARTYFATARQFANQALAGWQRNPKVSDEQFVIAAYQASQIYGIGINAQAWSLAFGGDQLRQIGDVELRRDLTVILTADYEPLAFAAVSTPYREHVRQIIPDDVQEQIRAQCGDRNIMRDGGQYTVILPRQCGLKLDPRIAAQTAAALRAHPELVGQLNWHLAAIATYLENADGIEQQMRMLQHTLDRRGRRA